jgi:hypothetical protein
MKILIFPFIVFPICSLAQTIKSTSDKKIPLNFTNAIEHFVLETASNNFSINDTVVIFSLDKSVVDTISKKIRGKFLEFITWEETMVLLLNRDTVQAFQIWTTNFDDHISFVFLPLKIFKNDIIRDYENMCGVSYYLNKKTKKLDYEGTHCGSSLKIEN